MARYMNVDEAIAFLRKECMQKYPISFCNGIYAATKELETIPEADVVPKSEVDWHREAELNAQRIIELEAEVERLQKELSGHKQYYFISKTNTVVAREIFEELERIGLVLPYEDYAELKKKYTEGE